ncbi:hypothetical protein M885DRAFT_520282 [Pelagophyceae sp. CCMP2097]|nr:hypothetical protein M885DRAFT_520282 [Pelagophyceae sp. CCMP2097]
MRQLGLLVWWLTGGLALALSSPRRLGSPLRASPSPVEAERDVVEAELVSALEAEPKASDAQLQQIVARLPASFAPTAAALAGDWLLLHTSKSNFDIRNPLGRRTDGTAPGLEKVFDALGGGGAAASSSPIQRAVTSNRAIDVSQNILFDAKGVGRVDQLVDIGPVTLRLSAAARLGDSGRVEFAFDLGYFKLGGLRLPYPVPFQLLGDEAKGFLDTLYVSEKLRVSKGNKGTTFILVRR